MLVPFSERSTVRQGPRCRGRWTPRAERNAVGGVEDAFGDRQLTVADLHRFSIDPELLLLEAEAAADFAVVNRESNNVSVLLSKGDGTLVERLLH